MPDERHQRRPLSEESGLAGRATNAKSVMLKLVAQFVSLHASTERRVVEALPNQEKSSCGAPLQARHSRPRSR